MALREGRPAERDRLMEDVASALAATYPGITARYEYGGVTVLRRDESGHQAFFRINVQRDGNALKEWNDDR